MSGVGTGIALAAGIGGIGAIGGAAISANAAGNAAQTQASAAEQAQQLQADEANKALDFQKQEWSTQQSNLAPWLQQGQTALSSLSALTGTPGQGLLTPFTPPTAAEAAQYPGYQFQLQQGEGALQNSAAARGDIGGGNTQEALTRYAQDFAQNDYTNVYNQAFNTFQANQSNHFNRLASIAGLGQTAATNLGSEGQAAAGNVGNIALTTGAQQGQQMNNAAAATASGYVGQANAWGGALGGSTNSLAQLAMMNQIFGGQSSSGLPPGQYTYGADPTLAPPPSGGWA